MKEYLGKIMHQSIDERIHEDISKLPLGCRNTFEMKIMKMGHNEFLLVASIENMNLTKLRKIRLQLEKYL